FWKQFFEASANVSLSGYEELANDDESSVMEDSTAVQDESTADYTRDHEDGTATPVARDATGQDEEEEESLFGDADLSGSTPRPPATKTFKADGPGRGRTTPYDSMKREMRSEEQDTTVLQDEEDSTVLFAQRTAQLPDMSLTPRGQRDEHTAEQRHSARRTNKDPLLHRVLDKNYRVQSTPHGRGIRISPLKKDKDKDKDKDKGGKGKERAMAAWQEDDSAMSSPEIAPPTLRSEFFMSPYKLMARQRVAAAASQGPRTPGVSVQTPARGQVKSRDVFSSAARGRAAGGAGDVGPSTTRQLEGRPKYEIDWDSDGDDDDDDLYAGMSPPKTIQFALPPSKLLQTPAREASRRIVDDILMDAGAELESSEYSPTMVKMNEDILNDSF
ncbi:hypothetical protein E4U43_000245, partial [Claviceps pusilla]